MFGVVQQLIKLLSSLSTIRRRLNYIVIINIIIVIIIIVTSPLTSAVVVQGLCKMFGVGYVVQLLIKLLSSMSTIRRRPREIVNILRAPGTFGMAAFLGLYSAVFRVSETYRGQIYS